MSKGGSAQMQRAEQITLTPHRPHFARNITQDEIKNFGDNLRQQGKADYLRRVIESNDHQPHQFDKFHQNNSKKFLQKNNWLSLGNQKSTLVIAVLEGKCLRIWNILVLTGHMLMRRMFSL